MSSRVDDLIDRRRLRRKLSFWRIITFLVLLCVVGFGLIRSYGGEGAQIAKILIQGTITDDRDLLERLARVRDNDDVKGLILFINSPGGTTVGGEAIFNEIRSIAAKKPVIAQVGTLAASAGYMIASATDHIMARESSLVGSIGVLVQYPDLTGMMDKLGIKFEEIKSSPLKASPNPFTPTTDEARQMISRVIMDSYDWFIGLVAERRGLPRDEVVKLADGSIFTGRQALKNKLIDSIGGEREAVKWLESRDIGADLPVIEWKPKSETGLTGWAGKLAQSDLNGEALGEAAQQIVSRLGGEHLFLDGLISVWHPAPMQPAP